MEIHDKNFVYGRINPLNILINTQNFQIKFYNFFKSKEKSKKIDEDFEISLDSSHYISPVKKKKIIKINLIKKN
jgi:hypothetical protein